MSMSGRQDGMNPHAFYSISTKKYLNHTNVK